MLLVSLEKRQIPGGFYRNIASLLNKYKVFDFAIVALYRLYAYIHGYLNTQNIDELKLQEQMMLSYHRIIASGAYGSQQL